MIGAALGEGNILKAKQIFKLTFYICTFFGGLIIICLVIFSDKIIALYDEDKKIISLSSAGLISYCFAVFPPYFTEMMLQALIQGVGIQSEAQIPSIICYIFICLPSSYYFAFNLNLGISGLFYGLALGQIIINLMFIRVVYNIDWNKQAEIVKQREQSQDEPDTPAVQKLDDSYDCLIDSEAKTTKSEKEQGEISTEVDPEKI